MDRFVPFEKMSKRQKREQLARKRRTWGALNPVTRRPENPKAYNRPKAKRRDKESKNESFGD